MEKYNLVCSTSSGIEAVTKQELISMGIKDIRIDNCKLFFEGTKEQLYTTNMSLRTASRVYIMLASFEATTFDQLYNELQKIDYAKSIGRGFKLHITASCSFSKLMAYSSVQSVSYKAIIEKITMIYGNNCEGDTTYHIDINIHKDHAYVLLDTSGDGLHKRGYRVKSYDAPVKENIAAAILLLSGWTADRCLIDPFCGSGTIPIEAALIAMNIAPNLNRVFAFECFCDYDKELHNNVKAQLVMNENRDVKLRIYGYDISNEAIRISNCHKSLAGVDNAISFNVRDMREVSTRFQGGYVITNPPYAVRLMTTKQVSTLYKDFFAMYKRLEGFKLLVLSGFEETEKAFGERAKKNRKLYNGNLTCRLYFYY